MSLYRTPSTSSIVPYEYSSEYSSSVEHLLRHPVVPFISAAGLDTAAGHPLLGSPFSSTSGSLPSSATSPISITPWSPSSCSTSSGSFAESRAPSSVFTSPASSVTGKQKRQKHSPPVVVHPYARLEAKKSQEQQGVVSFFFFFQFWVSRNLHLVQKRRKVWDHLLEKRIFSVDEMQVFRHPMLENIFTSFLGRR